MIKDFHAQVGHAHFVGVWKEKGVAHRYGMRVLDHGAVFAAHVAHRFFHAFQERVNPFRKVQGSTSTDKHPIYFSTKSIFLQRRNVKELIFSKSNGIFA